MASLVSGIAIVIKAFLPTGKTVDEQFNALSLVKAAHETGDYSAVLKAAKIDEVKAEQKTRRMEDQPQPEPPREGANAHGLGPDVGTGPNPDYKPDADQETATGDTAGETAGQPETETEAATGPGNVGGEATKGDAVETGRKPRRNAA